MDATKHNSSNALSAVLDLGADKDELVCVDGYEQVTLTIWIRRPCWMTRKSFAQIPFAEVADPELDSASESTDVESVLGLAPQPVQETQEDS